MGTFRTLLRILVLGAFVVSFKGMAQDSSGADLQLPYHASGRFYPFLRATTFFRNNEYRWPYALGYTLPGYRLSGALGFSDSTLLKGVDVRIGATVRGFFGAGHYPAGTWYGELTDFSPDVFNQPYPYFSPLVSVEVRLTPWASLAFGHYDTTESPHRLPMPLYNSELNLSAPPEQGIRFRVGIPALEGDLWIDWQRFIYPKEKKQELFTAGLSLQGLLYAKNGFRLFADIYATASHRGGEINVMKKEEDIVRTYLASMGGLRGEFSLPVGFSTPMELRTSIYGGFSAVGQESTPKGSGVYILFEAAIGKIALATDLWFGKNFNASMGGPFVNTLSRWVEGRKISATSFWHFSPRWELVRLNSLEIGLEGNLWWHFSPRDEGHGISHAASLYLCYTPRF